MIRRVQDSFYIKDDGDSYANQNVKSLDIEGLENFEDIAEKISSPEEQVSKG